jgi:hypothetical protein
MSDTPRKEQVEQQAEAVEQSVDKIVDLPEKGIEDQSAQTVKGGIARRSGDEGPEESILRLR